jgi:hypothetical protein
VEDACTALQLVKEKIKYGPEYGVSVTKGEIVHISEVLASKGKKSVLVNILPSKELVRGNISIDSTGKVEKYINQDYALVVTEWRELIERSNYNERSQDLAAVLNEWNTRLEALSHQADENTGFLILSGDGDSGLVSQ